MRVPQSIRNRRIKNELSKLNLSRELDISNNITMKIEVGSHPIKLRLDINNNQVIELSINLVGRDIAGKTNLKVYMPMMDYPFEPPTIKIDDKKLYSIQKKLMKTRYFKKRLSEANPCLCCKTILCKDNWRLTYGVKEIINEVAFLLNIWQKNVEMLHMDKIIIQKLGIDFEYMFEFIL